MAIIKCLECGAEVSDKAVSCIKCGCPINKNENQDKERQTKKRVIFTVLIVAVIIVVCAIIMVMSSNKIPEGYTEEYYREAEKYIADCEKYIENPTEDNYPDCGEHFEKIMDEKWSESTLYTAKDFALAQQQLYTSMEALFFGVGKATEEEFREEIEKMKELMELH